MLRKPHKQKDPGAQSAENHKNIFISVPNSRETTNLAVFLSIVAPRPDAFFTCCGVNSRIGNPRLYAMRLTRPRTAPGVRELVIFLL